jgi:hypothetical protein
VLWRFGSTDCEAAQQKVCARGAENRVAVHVTRSNLGSILQDSQLLYDWDYDCQD